MHEVRMHELRPKRPGGVRDPEWKAGIEVVPRPDASERDPSLLEHGVERARRAARIVEPDERRLNPVRPECGQQREQVPFGAADPGDPVDVDDAHQRRRRARACPIAEAARRTRRKSQGAR